MKISPYISFSGNCEDAVTLYEKAFNTKAKTMYLKDAPPDESQAMSVDNENFIMHSQLEVGGEIIMFSDMPPEFPFITGTNVAVMVEFDDTKTAKSAFDVLKENGTVTMELQETFWSKYFGSLTDKFGVNWNISIMETGGCGD